MSFVSRWGVVVLLMFSSSFGDERDPQLKIVQDGVKFTHVAEHPGLATPTGIDVDAQGRIWVVATHTHFRPDDYVGPEHDEILVFSDADGDGRIEKRTVFYNKTDATMDLELGPDGWVYLAERDRILRVKDTDGDGKADAEQQIAGLTTEAVYPHNGLEGLAWHPDGDLIFGLGENFAKPWTLTGPDGRSVSGTGEGGIFRCAADGTKLRRIAHGFWNPFGICVRADGEIFAAENDPGERPPCRLLHIVEGGDYGYQRSYGPEAHHPFVGWNGELRGTLPMVHPSGEAPCGILPLGRGLLVPSWSDHRVDFFLLRRDGASFSATRKPLVRGGRYFRPGCIASVRGGEGGTGRTRTWYLTDWVDGRYQSHGFGRLWKLEIDLDQADWVGNPEPEPPTSKSRLAAALRNGTAALDRERLLRLAGDTDAFLSRAALQALGREASSWKQEEVAGWSGANRLHALLALRLSDAPAATWAQTFLADDDEIVQFEALRWIADARLNVLAENVDRYLTRRDLDFQRFEAAVAAANTLNGKPEAGVRNPAMLLARVQDANAAPGLRAFALRMLPTQARTAPKDGSAPIRAFPKGLTLNLLRELLAVNDDVLSLEVVRVLGGNPTVSQKLLAEIAGDSKRGVGLRAEATAGLAGVAESHVALLLRLASDANTGVREEALRCLRLVKLVPEQLDVLKQVSGRHTASADAFRAVLDPNALERGRPKATDTDVWLALLKGVPQPADPAAGERLFHNSRIAQCSNCHRHSGRGNVVGPDLSALSRRDDRKWLLQSILEPSREMAPEYQPRTVVLSSGETFTGIRLRSSTQEAMRDAHGQNRTFNRNDIEAMVESPVSFMPAGVVNSLTVRELRDLIAFLSR